MLHHLNHRCIIVVGVLRVLAKIFWWYLGLSENLGGPLFRVLLHFYVTIFQKTLTHPPCALAMQLRFLNCVLYKYCTTVSETTVVYATVK